MSFEPQSFFDSEIAVPQHVSKKRHIYEKLLERIKNQTLPVGSRLPSGTVLASEWQVAYATVHAALNDLTRDGWLVRSPKLGTFVSSPPRPNAGQLVDSIVVALPPRGDIVDSGNGNEVFEMLQGLTEGARLNSGQIRIESLKSEPDVSEFDRGFEAIKTAAGAVFIGRQYLPLIERLVEAGVSVVTLGEEPGCGSMVTYDRSHALERAVAYLAERGSRRVGYFGNTRDQFGKFDAYRAALQAQNLPYDERRNCHCPAVRDAGAALQSFLNSRPDCDALLALNYQMAFVFAQEAKHRGIRLPEDIALLGMGVRIPGITDLAISYMRIPYLELGLEAMKLLLQAKPSCPGQGQTREIVTLQAELVCRATT